MEKIPESGKKLPLLVVGKLPIALPGASALEIALLHSQNAPFVQDFYVIVGQPAPEAEATLKALYAAGLSSDQVLIVIPIEQAIQNETKSHHCVIERFASESMEEFRVRLLARLEMLRQMKLTTALTEAQNTGHIWQLQEQELSKTLDATRIAHALACGYALSPLSHAKVLRETLGGACKLEVAAGELKPDRLIPPVATALSDAFHRGEPAREAIRRLSSGLSFRTRTDLLHQIETYLAPLLGGKNAA